LIFFRASI